MIRQAFQDAGLWLAAALLGLAIALMLWPRYAFAVRFTPLPAVITTQVCVERVYTDGVRIGQIRWRPIDITIQQWRDLPHASWVPDWYRDLIDGWIDQAIAWPGTEDDWLGYILENCYVQRVRI